MAIPYLDYLASRALGSRASLPKVKAYLRQKGNPHRALRVFHVTGTNGKGSVCVMLSQVLHQAFGKRVGLFTSPHLISYQERIQVNGVPISETDLNRLIKHIEKDGRGCSFFELLTLVAIFYFLEQHVDYAIIEVGIGAKHDTTNLWQTPLATFITSISSDHEQLLGPGLVRIQWNKMAIMKPGIPCYTPVDNRLMHEGARRKKASLRIIKDLVPTALLGEHQQHNAALVLHALQDLGFAKKRILQGLLQVEHPGRLQWLTPHILLDGAHNSEGIIALKRYVATIKDQFPTLTTIFATTKNTEHIAAFAHDLLHGEKNFVLTPTAQTTKKYHTSLPFTFSPLSTIQDVVALLRAKDQGLIVVYGSLFLIGDILATRGTTE